ncbi:MAG: response regulator [Bacteriovoracaceae bacterium]|jgi:DNA-binding NtrC family response regulator
MCQKRILIVDDEEAIRDSLAWILLRKGYLVETVSGGKSALKLMMVNSFDALISDVQMPEGNGLELLREVQERELKVPVFLMTGSQLSTQEALDAGAFFLIRKPTDITKIPDLLNNYFSGNVNADIKLRVM